MSYKINIIIVDDSEMDLKLTQKVFQNLEISGFIRTYASAEEALEHLPFVVTKNSNQKTLVISDICMDGMSGFDFAEEFKKISPKGFYFCLISNTVGTEVIVTQQYDAWLAKRPWVLGLFKKPLLIDMEKLQKVLEDITKTA